MMACRTDPVLCGADFTERMKSLGYHRRISLDNFRSPNFELVADILYWLAERYHRLRGFRLTPESFQTFPSCAIACRFSPLRHKEAEKCER
jgi:hypothetical protein